MHAVSDPKCYACRHADYDFNIPGGPKNVPNFRLILMINNES